MNPLIKNNPIRHVLVYLRVSSLDQARKENPISAQRDACLKYVKQQGYEYDPAKDEYLDNGISGRSDGRPAFKRMFERLKTDPSVQAVVAYDLSRIFRNGREYMNYKEELKNCGKRFLSVSEMFGDEDDPAGFLNEWMLAGFAEFRSRQDGQKIRLGMRRKAETGTYPGKSPYGFKNMQQIIAGKDARWIEPHPEEAGMIRKIFELYATGKYSFQDIADWLNEHQYPTRNGKPWKHSSVEQILKKRIYIGYIDWGGIQNENGLHEKLISRELFYKVQATIEARNYNANRKRKYTFMLRGLSYCGECGCRMTAYYKRKDNKVYGYYGCTKKKGGQLVECDQPSMRVEELEGQLQELIKIVQMPPRYCDGLLRKVKDFIHRESKSSDDEKRSITSRIEDIQKHRRQLLEKYVGGNIQDGEYQAYRADLDTKEAHAKAELVLLDTRGQSTIQIIETATELVKDCYKAYKKASFENRVALVQTIFKEVIMKDWKITSVTLNRPFDYICGAKIKRNAVFQLGTLGGDGRN